MNDQAIALFWFRRDLRWDDNTGLYHALSGDHPVLPLFIFDTGILNDLGDPEDPRITFIYDTLSRMNQELSGRSTCMEVRQGNPVDVWETLLTDFNVAAVYTNRDYEPYARSRDGSVKELLEKHNIPFYTFRDHVLLEPQEVLKDDESPYVVYTPYSKKWKETLKEEDLENFPSALYFENFVNREYRELPPLSYFGFTPSDMPVPDSEVSDELLSDYAGKRNFPAADGTSRMGIHLRFGTVSIRKLAAKAKSLSNTYLNELIWREFYQMILWHFPQVVDTNFHRKYDAIEWKNNKDEFEKWCNGMTGYPIVDAGMRELNQTGYMHNRVRMITASFLTKHLLIDWRWGEAYFAAKLLDYELASNNGGWQWAAGTGTDAQPYFRIFNPYTQAEKFDKNNEYINKWVPEITSSEYPEPMVDHKQARERALDVYKEALR